MDSTTSLAENNKMKYPKVQAYSHMRHRREQERANDHAKAYTKMSHVYLLKKFNLMNTKLTQARRFCDKLRFSLPPRTIMLIKDVGVTYIRVPFTLIWCLLCERKARRNRMLQLLHIKCCRCKIFSSTVPCMEFIFALNNNLLPASCFRPHYKAIYFILRGEITSVRAGQNLFHSFN